MSLSKVVSSSSKKLLEQSYDIHYVLDNFINSKSQGILDSLSNLLIAKAYFATIDPDHNGSDCYLCTLNYMLRDNLIDRGVTEKYLVSVTHLKNFVETEPFYSVKEEWYEKYVKSV